MSGPVDDTKPGSVLTSWRDPKTRHDLLVELEFAIVDGRVAPVAVTIKSRNGEPVAITAALVRRVPLGALTAKYLRQTRERLLGLSSDRSVKASTRARAKVLAERHGPHRGRQLSPDELQEVAEVYRDAYEIGDPVQEAVAKHFVISLSTAAKRIGLARAAGYLGPANGRQAGEKTTTIKKGRAQ